MIDSPLVHELMAETQQQAILLFLEGRFGSIPEMLSARVKSVSKAKELQELIKFAGQCPDLRAFEAHLPVEKPRATSSRKTPRRRKDSADQ